MGSQRVQVSLVDCERVSPSSTACKRPSVWAPIKLVVRPWLRLPLVAPPPCSPQYSCWHRGMDRLRFRPFCLLRPSALARRVWTTTLRRRKAASIQNLFVTWPLSAARCPSLLSNAWVVRPPTRCRARAGHICELFLRTHSGCAPRDGGGTSSIGTLCTLVTTHCGTFAMVLLVCYKETRWLSMHRQAEKRAGSERRHTRPTTASLCNKRHHQGARRR